jgi:prophage regulatory protein
LDVVTPSIDFILRLPQVEQATGYKRSHIYALESKGEFPKRIALGPRSVGWRQSDIKAWLDSRQHKVA